MIQLASSLRNVGEASTGLAMLEAERAGFGADHLDDALACTTALCLAAWAGSARACPSPWLPWPEAPPELATAP